MSFLLASEAFNAPHIDYAGLSPEIALSAGIVVVLMAGVFKFMPRWSIAALTLIAIGATAGCAIWQWGESKDLVSGALRLDDLALSAILICCFAAAVCVLLSFREPAAEQSGLGEYYCLLLGSLLGMALLTQAQTLVSFFIGIELLSIPLYVLCASDVRRERSLESGLKYLVIGSLGSATLLYGLALIFGGSGSIEFTKIAHSLGAGGNADDTLILIGTAMVATGLAFKISLAPFHQWTPDVYEGAPTPVTAFMAVATKAAAFIAFVRLFEVALAPDAGSWEDALAVLAAISIAVGNIGALNQNSMKRLLGYSGIAQAGYILAGLVVFTDTGLEALIFYLAAYCLMNLAVFAVVVARERETNRGDDISALEGIGASRPLLAWPLTIGILGLAGIPGTVGFMGKLYLIEAAVDDRHTWIGVAIVIGTMISLAYYLRVIAAVWMKPDPGPAGSRAPLASGGEIPAIAGADPAADEHPAAIGRGSRVDQVLLAIPALICGAATVFFGIVPTPLINWASNAAASLF